MKDELLDVVVSVDRDYLLDRYLDRFRQNESESCESHMIDFFAFTLLRFHAFALLH